MTAVDYEVPLPLVLMMTVIVVLVVWTAFAVRFMEWFTPWVSAKVKRRVYRRYVADELDGFGPDEMQWIRQVLWRMAPRTDTPELVRLWIERDDGDE